MERHRAGILAAGLAAAGGLAGWRALDQQEVYASASPLPSAGTVLSPAFKPSSPKKAKTDPIVTQGGTTRPVAPALTFSRPPHYPEGVMAPPHRHSLAEEPNIPVPPQFRVAPRRTAAVPGRSASTVTLEFADSATFPAILTASSAGDPVPGTKQAAVEAAIQEAFINSIASTPAESPQPVTDTTVQDQAWENAAKTADEQFRLLVGQDVYIRKSLEAARLKMPLIPYLTPTVGGDSSGTEP